MFDKYNTTQAAADAFKRIVLNLPTKRRNMQPALDAISRFERCPWHHRAMTDTVDAIAPSTFGVDGYSRLEWLGSTSDVDLVVGVVTNILTRYAEVMPPENEGPLFTSEEAAAYLGISIDGLKYHVHRKSNLEGIKKGHDLMFTQKALDDFNATRREPGRPRQVKS